MARGADERLLARATELQRLLFTNDTDLLAIACDWMLSGRRFAGLAFAQQLGITIGEAIADLELIAKTSDPDGAINWVAYLPLYSNLSRASDARDLPDDRLSRSHRELAFKS